MRAKLLKGYKEKENNQETLQKILLNMIDGEVTDTVMAD